MQSPSRSSHATRAAAEQTALAFAAEHRFVTAAQVAALLDVDVAAASRRLRSLTAAGALERQAPLRGRPALYRATAAGIRAAGGDLRAAGPVALALQAHDQALGWLMLRLLEGGLGEVAMVIGERRMRSEDRRASAGQPRHGVRLGGTGPRGESRLHYPDLIAVTPEGRRVAFELERTTKGPARLEGILAGYAADRRIDAVVYLAEREGTAAAVRRAARRMRLAGLVSVYRVRLEPDRTPRGHAAAPARSGTVPACSGAGPARSGAAIAAGRRAGQAAGHRAGQAGVGR
ncbi:MAG TPA: replication-relaxation family protein [Solirubrobacteraceae bacterium]|nr:replication-relaxation family protein [Solirubrobacteraceae bacterium]